MYVPTGWCRQTTVKSIGIGFYHYITVSTVHSKWRRASNTRFQLSSVKTALNPLFFHLNCRASYPLHNLIWKMLPCPAPSFATIIITNYIYVHDWLQLLQIFYSCCFLVVFHKLISLIWHPYLPNHTWRSSYNTI